MRTKFYTYHNLQGSQTEPLTAESALGFTLIIIYKVLKLVDTVATFLGVLHLS